MTRILMNLALCVAFLGCEDGRGLTTDPLPSDVATDVTPQDMGNGVYYFPVTETKFVKSLVKFKEDHPGLVVTTMAGNGSAYSGINRGYFVVIEKREACTCSKE